MENYIDRKLHLSFCKTCLKYHKLRLITVIFLKKLIKKLFTTYA